MYFHIFYISYFNLHCNSSLRYANSLYTEEFTFLLNAQEIKILLRNCFVQQQLMYSLMMDQ